MKDNLIIIGGCGLVGSATIEFIKKKTDLHVIILDKKQILNFKKINFYKCDISEKDFYKSFINKLPKKSYVVNLAARQYADKPPNRNRLNWFCSTNYEGGINVLNFAKKIEAKGFIQFSTDMVYGIPQHTSIQETNRRKPLGEYGTSKLKIENYIIKNRKKFDFPITIFRPRMIIGKGRLGVLKNLFTLIKLNLPIPLIGKGNNYYQMVSDKDCALAIYLCLKAKCPEEIFNLGSYVKMNVKNLLFDLVRHFRSHSFIMKTPASLIKLVLKILSNFGLEILYKEQYELADKNFVVSINKAKKVLGWRPKHSDITMLKIAYEDWLKGK